MSMNRILQAALTVLLLLSTNLTFAASPETYHLPFENFEFKSDDWVDQSGFKSIEDRKWEIVDGKFGKALYLGAVPLKYDNDNMSGLDLDMVTAVIFNVGYAGSKGRGYDEPFIWGAGKLHPGSGAVAFWVKGDSTPEDKDTRTILFEQTTTSWGRKERQLIEIELFRNGTINAYVEDARYVQHNAVTKKVWKNKKWNHVLLNWDKAEGISLWINGKKAASSEGSDSWWDNQRPGLFHLPMAQSTYDEFYIFDRPLNEREIKNLYRSNDVPDTNSPAPLSPESAERLKKAFTPTVSSLPAARPSAGNALVFKEIIPERIHDEGIQGWWISDGRYELAWPHEYSLFTVIPGDVDFHAEKADILPPKTADVNYMTFEGNLDGVTVIKGDREGRFDTSPALTVPQTESFFYGAMLTGLGDSELRIPFTKSYGAPPGFESDGDVLSLPLSGDLRLHEVNLFNVSEKTVSECPGSVRYHLDPRMLNFEGDRYPHALSSLYDNANRKALGLYKSRSIEDQDDITLNAMRSVHLIGETITGKAAFNSILLDLEIETVAPGTALRIKLLDSAVPSHTWTHAEMRLDGFTPGEKSRLKVALEFDPLIMVSGDRLWIEIMSTDEVKLSSGESTVTLLPEIDWVRAEPKFAMKTLRPNILSYGRSFEYIAWEWDKQQPNVDKPSGFGGMFDMAYPWQAVLKVNPGDRIANIYKVFASGDRPKGRYPSNMDNLPEPVIAAPDNAPDWAVYFRKLQSFREQAVTWWRHHQRSDGQAGGGWNDDTLIFSRAFGDMPLDSNKDALALYNNVFDGFDKTNYFKDGYCRIHPIDRLHNGDFVRERYKSLIYNLGDPRSAVWSCEEAWHWGKEDQTPVNYGNGRAFLFGKDVMEWYWGRRKAGAPYKLSDEGKRSMTETLKKAAVVNDEIALWRLTEAWCHSDDQSQYGANQLPNMLLGGWGKSPRRGDDDADSSNITPTLGVGWIEGGGPQLGRLVEYSGDKRLKVQLYSFDRFDRHVVARLYRLEPGQYRILLKIDSDGDGSFKHTLTSTEKSIKRFDRLEFDVPSKIPVLLEVTQIVPAPDKGDLPDLAVSPFFSKLEGSKLTVTVHNIGAADAGKFEVLVTCPGGMELNTKVVDGLKGAADFMPGKIEMIFENLPPHPLYRVYIDRNGHVDEIFKENNEFSIVSGMF